MIGQVVQAASSIESGGMMRQEKGIRPESSVSERALGVGSGETRETYKPMRLAMQRARRRGQMDKRTWRMKQNKEKEIKKNDVKHMKA